MYGDPFAAGDIAGNVVTRDRAAAVREADEQVADALDPDPGRARGGWRGDLGAELEPTRYEDGKGRDKLVRWWELWVRERGDWEPNDEVDDLMWVPLSEVDSLLTYESDRGLAEQVRTADRRGP